MSKCNQPSEFWVNYKLNNVTIIRKIGEKQFNSKSANKKYIYNTDILLARCSCGYEYQVNAKSFLANKCNSCRRCAMKKENNIGQTVNNLLCEDSYHKTNISGRSVIWLKTVCNICGNNKDVKADIFRCGECSCSICNKKIFNKLGNNKNPARYFSKLKLGAKKRNIEFNIELNDIIDTLNKQNGKCNLSGTLISFDDGSLSIDRINNNLGYIKSNIQCVHRTINYMKGTNNQDDFIKLCESIYFWNKKI